MSRKDRFVSPEVQRLEISDGDWVLIKKRLGLAESKRLESAIFRGIQAPQQITDETQPQEVEMRIDSAAAYMVKLQVYLVDWSLCDAHDKPVKLSYAAIDNLDPTTADEIMAALNAYLDAEAKAKANPPGEQDSEKQSA